MDKLRVPDSTAIGRFAATLHAIGVALTRLRVDYRRAHPQRGYRRYLLPTSGHQRPQRR